MMQCSVFFNNVKLFTKIILNLSCLTLIGDCDFCACAIFSILIQLCKISKNLFYVRLHE